MAIERVPSENELRDTIARLIEASDARLEIDSAARRSAMVPILRAAGRYEEESRRWLEEIAMPRLKMVAELFPNSTGPVRSPSGDGLTVEFSHTDEFPARARIEVRVSRGPDPETALLTFDPLILPMLMRCEEAATVALNLETPDLRAAGEFIDSRIVRFVSDYLSIREPDSAYQHGLMVIDPVCGMSFRRADAAASVEHDGSRFYFCMHACRESFEHNPDRYLRRGAWGNLRVVRPVGDAPARNSR